MRHAHSMGHQQPSYMLSQAVNKPASPVNLFSTSENQILNAPIESGIQDNHGNG